MTTAPAAFRSKRVCLSMEDWFAVSEALAEEWPKAIYCPFYLQDAFGQHPPQLTVGRSLHEVMTLNDRRSREIVMIPNPKWKAELHQSSSGEWRISFPAFPRVDFRPGGQIVDEHLSSPPTIHSGEIDVRCKPREQLHFAFARRFFKLFSRFATNRNQIGVSYPGYEILWSIEKGSDTWLGLNAIRWAREDKRRLLYYDDRGWGYRPNDEGIVKPEE